MKKLLFAFFIVFSSANFAQNIQLHYDMGKDRNYYTTTVEMFKPDEYGSTYFFVDMDYNREGNKNVSLSYWEIARYVEVYKGISATVQYNDGFYHAGKNLPDGAIGHVWLAGASYPINLGFVTLNTDLLYRKDYQSEGSDVQLTTTWFVPFLEGKINFTGFMDIWTTKDFVDDGRKVVMITEPQIWYNPIKHLSVGTEIEISNNFIYGKNSVQVNPTIAAKWTF